MSFTFVSISSNRFRRLRYACRAFMAIMQKKHHVYADIDFISYEGDTIRVCNLMNDVCSTLKDEVNQDSVINQAKELICKSAN